jgi:hypothetical protein
MKPRKRDIRKLREFKRQQRVTHGTRYAYERAGCRCSECRHVQTERRKRQREKQNARRAPINHGTVAAYVGRKCRCDQCRAVWCEYSRPYARRWEREQTLKAARVVVGSAVNSARFRQQQLEAAQEIAERDPLLAELLAEQEKDARVGHCAESRWELSLDEPAFWDSREPMLRHETVAYDLERIGSDAPWVEPLIVRIDFWREIDRYAEAA